ncbi:hypothetical protein DSO57_1019740 [Entomophthora muscae]|uniref:Uncharacterized protein n=1 Tax=Entomophthora muscae TaxID=34485 RepID=A0ACC2U2F0_9FUNG|nr:hypothetical protein DSO57_1019740 [Entomophthora muscae]
MPYLGFSYSYQYLQRVIKQKLHYPQGCTKASPLNVTQCSYCWIIEQVSEAQYLAEEDQVEFLENIFEPKESLTKVEPTKSPIIQEEYSEKKQDLVHEVNSIEVLISKDKDTSLAAPIALLYLDLLESSPVDHNIRGEESAKDDDVVLHEVEIFGLHIFQKPPLSLPEPLPPEDPGTAKPFPIRAEDCFKDEKVSEDDEASQEEKVVELLISQVEYKSLAENVTVPLLSLPKSLPPEEPSFILQPHNKSCSRKEIEDKCLSK